MTISYRDMLLQARDLGLDNADERRIEIRVLASSEGESDDATTTIPPRARDLMGRMARREIAPDDVTTLGGLLAAALFPAPVRERFIACMASLRADERLRVRLRLDPALAAAPWECAHIPIGSGSRDLTGFLALDPRLSLVRHEALPLPGERTEAPRPRRVLAAFASPPPGERGALDVARERAALHAALDGVPNVTLDTVESATATTLLDHLQGGVDVFHFGGHGGVRNGRGLIVLHDERGRPESMDAAQLAVNLRSAGVRLAVLAACETSKRGKADPWGSVAAALLQGGLSAVVAMQVRISDTAALAFGRTLYRLLAAGHSLDEAVLGGRIAILNALQPGLAEARPTGRDTARPNALRSPAGAARYWSDWAAPTLYCRAEGTLRLPAIADAPSQERVAREAVVQLRERLHEIGPGSVYRAVRAGTIAGGRIDASTQIGSHSGASTGMEAGRITGGDVSVATDIKHLDGGEHTGLVLGRVGPDAPDTREASGAPAVCAACGQPVANSVRFCPHCGAPQATRRFCTQCGHQVTAGDRFCPGCGQAVP